MLDSSLRIKLANRAFYDLFGVSEAETVNQLIYDLGNGQWDIPTLRVLLEEMLPDKSIVENYEVEHNFAQIGHRDMLLNARRIEEGGEREPLILVAIQDISQIKGSQRHQKLLVAELSHRVKNTLAVVQSIATQTLRSSDSVQSFGEAFSGRLEALSRAHDLAIQNALKDIPLGEIVGRAMKPFSGGGRMNIAEGPVVALGQVASQSLTMILHELATNAVKYGSLSASAGTVAIDWKVEPNGGAPRAVLDWVESGGPAVADPGRRGQGIRFIERSTAYELRGKAELAFREDGLRAKIDFPLLKQPDEAQS